MGHILQLGHVIEQVMAFARGSMHDTGGFFGYLEAMAQVEFVLTAVLEKFWGDVDDDAFICFARDCDGAMDFTSADKKNVSGGKGVVFAFDNIGSFTLKK